MRLNNEQIGEYTTKESQNKVWEYDELKLKYDSILKEEMKHFLENKIEYTILGVRMDEIYRMKKGIILHYSDG